MNNQPSSGVILQKEYHPHKSQCRSWIVLIWERVRERVWEKKVMGKNHITYLIYVSDILIYYLKYIIRYITIYINLSISVDMIDIDIMSGYLNKF